MPPPPAELFASRAFLGPALRAQPDRRLVGLVREGYESAFEEIVRRYRRQLERFAAAIVGARCEDVTQDAFSKALLALRGSEAEIELRPWLYRIVRNTALNDLRDRAPAAEQLTETLAVSGSAAAEVERREELADLMKRLGALPEPQRAAIVMRELEGLSHEEIATALGISGGAARQAIYRARAALREGLALVLPLPVVRALAEHADDAARGGMIAAGASAGSAGGAALGGVGGGAALKVGVATVLLAGTVGAGVVIEHQRGGADGPAAASAAPLPESSTGSSLAAVPGDSPAGEDRSDDDDSSHRGEGGDGNGEDRGGSDDGSSGSEGSRSGSGGSGHEGLDDHGGSGPSGGGGDGDGHQGSGGDGIDGGLADGPGSGPGGGDSPSSGSGGGEGGTIGSGGDRSGSEPAPDPEPVVEEPSGETESPSGGEGTGGGDGEISGGGEGGLDGSP